MLGLVRRLDDLDALPDDGLRYELVDGVLLVRPSPLFPHQVGQANLMHALIFEQAGVPSYWLLDPDVPSLTALELQDEVHVEVARAEAEQSLTVQRPFPVALVPAVLVA